MLLEESLLLTKVFLLAVRQNISWLFPILSDYYTTTDYYRLQTTDYYRTGHTD